MKGEIDIHGFESKLLRAEKLVRFTSVSRRNLELIKGFEEYCFSSGLTMHLRVKSSMWGTDECEAFKSKNLPALYVESVNSVADRSRLCLSALCSPAYPWLDPP